MLIYNRILAPIPHSFLSQTPATTQIYTLSLHDALPICRIVGDDGRYDRERYVPSWPMRYIDDNETGGLDRKSTRLNSSHVAISYAVFCLKKKNEEPKDQDTTRAKEEVDLDRPRTYEPDI